jgi:tetratricopeptide (TPR) repeat protein
VWNIKGNTLSILGRYKEAIVCYDKSLELDPTDEIVSKNRSIAYTRLGSSHADMSSENRKDNKIKILHFRWKAGYGFINYERRRVKVVIEESKPGARNDRPKYHYIHFYISVSVAPFVLILTVPLAFIILVTVLIL